MFKKSSLKQFNCKCPRTGEQCFIVYKTLTPRITKNAPMPCNIFTEIKECTSSVSIDGKGCWLCHPNRATLR